MCMHLINGLIRKKQKKQKKTGNYLKNVLIFKDLVICPNFYTKQKIKRKTIN